MNLSWDESIDKVDWQELANLYERAPLTKKQPDKLQQAFGNSLFRWIVRDGTMIVGAGRALADGCECAYVCDVALLPEYQGQGLAMAIFQNEPAYFAKGYITDD